MKCCIYVRVSTAAQTEGASLEAQEARARAWCEANGHEVAGVFEDAGISGGRCDNRPGLKRALAAVTKAKGILCVYSLSRLSRSVRDALDITERLEKAGVTLVSLSESLDGTTAAGKMMMRMLMVLADFERGLASERTTAGLAHLRSQGKRISGRAPFGYRVVGADLVPIPEQQAIIPRIMSMHADGHAYASIARNLTEENAPTSLGGKWSANTVRMIVLRGKREAV